MKTIWDTAREWAGQNHTTVEFELSRLQKRAVASRQRRAKARGRAELRAQCRGDFDSRWARGEVESSRLPYVD